MKSKFHTFICSVNSSEAWEPHHAKFPVSYSIQVSHAKQPKIAGISADRHLWYHHLPSQHCSRQSRWNSPI